MDFLPLDPTELRILGTLLEKALTTPEQYPLSLNSLQSGCNQKTSREPVTALTSFEIEGALRSLEQKRLVGRVIGAGARTERYRERLRERLGLDGEPQTVAVLTELFLRGPQQPGELRAHASRLAPIEDIAALETLLTDLEGRMPPYVRNLGRAPGERAPRFGHAFGRAVDAPLASMPKPAAPAAVPTPVAVPDALESRLRRLEARVLALEVALLDAGIEVKDHPPTDRDTP